MDKELFDQLTVPVPPYKGWRATLTRSTGEFPQVESAPAPVIEKEAPSPEAALEKARADALAEINREAPIDEEDARAREQAIAEIAAIFDKATREVITLPRGQEVVVERNSEGTIVSSEKIEQIEKETDFSDAGSWEELAEQIKAAGEVTSASGKQYTADRLLEQVNAARGGTSPDLVVTRTGNLRETVKRLLKEGQIDSNQRVPMRGAGQEALQEASRKAQEMAQKQPAA